MSGNQVVVLYNLDYKTEEHHIVVKQGEKLILVAKSSEDWWLVNRATTAAAAAGELSNDETRGEKLEDECSQLSEDRCNSTSENRTSSPDNHPFFVPSSYLRPVVVGYLEDSPDLVTDNYKMVKLKSDLDDSEKASDEAIGSSRDSLEVVDNFGQLEQMKSSGEVRSSRQRQRQPDNLSTANCDNLDAGAVRDRLEGIYMDPVELTAAPGVRAMPRKVRQEPEYANLSPLNVRKDLFIKSKMKHCLPSVGQNATMKRVLFDDWAEYEDENGRRFYYNSTSQHTSWKPPRRLTTKVEGTIDSTHGTGAGAQQRDSLAERKLSLDSQLVLNHHQDQSLGGDHSHSQSFESPNHNGVRSVAKTSHNGSKNGNSSTREQSTQTESDLHRNECSAAEWVISNVPKGWQGFINALTKEVFFMNQLNDHKWFCKRDENGRIYFYEENGQAMLTELPAFNDDDARRYMPNTDNTEMRDRQGHKATSGHKLSPRPGDGLHPNLDRSIKAHSVALMPNNRVAKPGDMIVFQENFKHSSPFKNVSVIFPPPPTSLNMKDIINSGTLNRTRTVVASKVSKRKNWGTSYVVLTRFYLLFFKDQKSAFVTSGLKPEFVLGLPNASIDWCPNKSSRKNCFELTTFQDQVLLQDDNNDHSAKWFFAIRDCISKLPTPLETSSVKTTTSPECIDKAGSFKLKRSRSTKQYRPNEEFSMPSGRATLSGYATIANTPMNDKKVKIRERLRQFLRKRPTMESLREKGIIKDENVFGCSLDQLCHRDKSPIPKFVQQCVEAIEYKDLKADGIYRACGNLSTVQKLRFEINQDIYHGLWKEEDVHVLTGLLKMFFRNMPEPLFPCDRFESLMRFIGIKDKKIKIESFRKLIHELPENNYQTLKFIMRHLLRITEHHQENRMSVQNLAIVFGPTLIWPMNDLNNLVLDMMLQMQQSQVIEFLLLEYESIFN